MSVEVLRLAKDGLNLLGKTSLSKVFLLNIKKGFWEQKGVGFQHVSRLHARKACSAM